MLMCSAGKIISRNCRLEKTSRAENDVLFARPINREVRARLAIARNSCNSADSARRLLGDRGRHNRSTMSMMNEADVSSVQTNGQAAKEKPHMIGDSRKQTHSL